MSQPQRTTAGRYAQYPELSRLASHNVWTLAKEGRASDLLPIGRRTTQEESELLRIRYAALIPEIQAYGLAHPDKWGRKGLTIPQVEGWAQSAGIVLDHVGIGLWTLLEEGIVK